MEEKNEVVVEAKNVGGLKGGYLVFIILTSFFSILGAVIDPFVIFWFDAIMVAPLFIPLLIITIKRLSRYKKRMVKAWPTLVVLILEVLFFLLLLIVFDVFELGWSDSGPLIKVVLYSSIIIPVLTLGFGIADAKINK